MTRQRRVGFALAVAALAIAGGRANAGLFTYTGRSRKYTRHDVGELTPSSRPERPAGRGSRVRWPAAGRRWRRAAGCS